MISDFTLAVEEAMNRVYPFLFAILWPLGIIAAVLIIGHAVTAARRPEGLSDYTAQTKFWGGASLKWGIALLLTTLAFFIGSAIYPAVDTYQQAIGQREFVKDIAGEGGSINQQSPYFAMLQETPIDAKVTVDSLLPGESVDRIVREVRDAVTQRLSMGKEPVVTVTQKEGNVEVAGSTTMTQEIRTPLDKALVHVTITPLKAKGSKSNAFHAKYEAEFSWSNPTDTEVTGRFSLTLPSNSGTFRGLSAEVDGKPFDDSDDYGTLRWEGKMAPGSQSTAKIKWETDASGTFTLVPGSGMRKSKSVRIELNAPDNIKLQRGSLPPTSTSGGTRVWQLDDVSTAQAISFAVPFEREKKESTAKVLLLVPFGVLMFGSGLMFLLRGDLRLSLFAPLLIVHSAASGLPISLIEAADMRLVLAAGHLIAAVLSFMLGGWRAAVLALCAGMIPLSGGMGDYSGLWVIVALVVGAWAVFDPQITKKSI